MSNWLKVIAFGCTHHPVSDAENTEWRNRQIAEFQPDVVVHMGDWMDADAASRWPNEHEWTLQDEYDAVAADARTINRLVPDAKKVWIMGNHDDNLESPNRIPKKLRDVCSWRNYSPLLYELSSWKIIPYGHRLKYEDNKWLGGYRIGQVTFQHGAEAGSSADMDQAVLYGVENGLWVGSHTHRPLPVQQAIMRNKIPLRYWFCNVGCGADWDKMEYVRRSNIARWGHGLLKLHVNPARSAFSSRQWEGEVVIRKMAH